MPGTVFPIAINRERSVLAAQQAVRDERPIGIVMQRDATVEEPLGIDLHRMGTVANILRYVTTPDGAHHVVLQGVQRFRVVEFTRERPIIVARVERVEEPETRDADVEARFMHLKSQAIEALQLLPQTPRELLGTVQAITAPGPLADLVAAYIDITPNERQELLETVDLVARIDKVSKFLSQRLEVLRLSNEIGQQTRAAFDKRQREAVLREQMTAIQRELGEGDSRAGRGLGRAQRKTEQGRQCPPKIEEQARSRIAPPTSGCRKAAEAGMARTHL